MHTFELGNIETINRTVTFSYRLDDRERQGSLELSHYTDKYDNAMIDAKFLVDHLFLLIVNGYSARNLAYAYARLKAYSKAAEVDMKTLLEERYERHSASTSVGQSIYIQYTDRLRLYKRWFEVDKEVLLGTADITFDALDALRRKASDAYKPSQPEQEQS